MEIKKIENDMMMLNKNYSIIQFLNKFHQFFSTI